MTHNDRLAVQLGLGAVLLWSTVATAFSLTLDYLSPLQLVTLATMFSWCFFVIRLMQPTRLAALRDTSWTQRGIGLLTGWLNPGGYYLVLFAAYDRLPAQEAMAINYSWGITLALIAAPILKHRLTAGALGAACISYLGIVVIATRGAPLALELAQPIGISLALLSTLIWSFYWVLNARLTTAPETNLLLNFSGALPLLFGLLWFTETSMTIPWQGWAGSAYIGLFEMGIAFILWMGAMKATSSALSITSLIFLSPPLSLVLIWLITGEPVELYTLFGLGLILLGLWLQRKVTP
jgi:drug/metabolite transporter (DMT)-like permease